MVVVGIISAEHSIHMSSLWNTEFSWKIFFVFLGLTSVISSACITKQIANINNGNDNQELSLLGKHIPPEQGESIARLLLISGGLISIISSWITAIPVLCIYFLWGIENRHTGFEWKNISIAGWLANSCVGILLFIIGWMLAMKHHHDNIILPLSVNTIYYMLPYILSFSAISLLTYFLEKQSNVDLGTPKIPFVLENSMSLMLSLFMVSVAFYISLKIIDPIASTAILVSLPFFIFAAFRRLNKDILRAIRYPIFIVNFFALPFYPWLVVPLLYTYYLSKYYYWHRFNLHYPTFLVDND